MKKRTYIKKPRQIEDKLNSDTKTEQTNIPLVNNDFKESISLNNIQFGNAKELNNVKNGTDIEEDEMGEEVLFEPENFFYDTGDVSLKDNFTIYFDSPVYSYSVNRAIDLIKQVNRNIAMTELEYPQLKGVLEVKFIINSGGGEIIQGLRLFDAIKNNVFPVNTIASGMAASMGIVLLVAGHKTQAVENSVLMIHQLSAGMGGKYFELRDHMKFYTDLQNKLSSILVENSKAKDKDIKEFMQGESFILATDALKLGIIDEILPTI